MINVKETMKLNEKVNAEYKGLVKAPYCSATEALSRRVYLQGLLKDLEKIETDLTQVVKANAMTLPYEQNKKYSKFVNGDLKILRHEVKRLIKAETEFELMGE